MAWTDKARQKSLERRRARRLAYDKLDWDMAMQVAAAGGGLARLQRCIEAHYAGPYPYPECDPRPRHHWRQAAYRLVCRMGLREAICGGKFQAGSTQGLVNGRRCPTCHRDLKESPWCPCVPRPSRPCPGCGETRQLGIRRLCRCERRELEKRAAGPGPQRRLVKWAKEVREARARKAAREAARAAVTTSDDS